MGQDVPDADQHTPASVWHSPWEPGEQRVQKGACEGDGVTVGVMDRVGVADFVAVRDGEGVTLAPTPHWNAPAAQVDPDRNAAHVPSLAWQGPEVPAVQIGQEHAYDAGPHIPPLPTCEHVPSAA